MGWACPDIWGYRFVSLLRVRRRPAKTFLFFRAPRGAGNMIILAKPNLSGGTFLLGWSFFWSSGTYYKALLFHPFYRCESDLPLWVSVRCYPGAEGGSRCGGTVIYIYIYTHVYVYIHMHMYVYNMAKNYFLPDQESQKEHFWFTLFKKLPKHMPHRRGPFWWVHSAPIYIYIYIYPSTNMYR